MRQGIYIYLRSKKNGVYTNTVKVERDEIENERR